MDNDKSLLKWSGAAVATVVVCFFLGYFILPRTRGDEPQPPAPTPSPEPTPAPRQLAVEAVPTQRLTLNDITAQKEAERRKLEERKKQDALAAEKAARDAETAAGGGAEDGTLTLTPDNGAIPPPDGTPPPTDGTTAPPEPATDNPGAPRVSVPPPAGDVKPAGTEPRTGAERPTGSDSLFRVRVGDPVASRSAADTLAGELRGRGFQPIVLKTDRGYVVQMGAFRDRKGAEEKQKELADKGYDAHIR